MRFPAETFKETAQVLVGSPLNKVQAIERLSLPGRDAPSFQDSVHHRQLLLLNVEKTTLCVYGEGLPICNGVNMRPH